MSRVKTLDHRPVGQLYKSKKGNGGTLELERGRLEKVAARDHKGGSWRREGGTFSHKRMCAQNKKKNRRDGGCPARGWGKRLIGTKKGGLRSKIRAWDSRRARKGAHRKKANGPNESTKKRKRRRKRSEDTRLQTKRGPKEPQKGERRVATGGSSQISHQRPWDGTDTVGRAQTGGRNAKKTDEAKTITTFRKQKPSAHEDRTKKRSLGATFGEKAKARKNETPARTVRNSLQQGSRYSKALKHENSGGAGRVKYPGPGVGCAVGGKYTTHVRELSF